LDDEERTISQQSSNTLKNQKIQPSPHENDEDEEEGKKNSVNSSTNSSINISNMNPLPIENLANIDDDDEEIDTSDLMHLEPKLRDAWIKMRKLDKILSRVLKREKQVKIETQALIQKNRAELELLRVTSDHKESHLEAKNTAQFLALTYVHLEDEEIDRESTAEPGTPVFKTQWPYLDENEMEQHNNNKSANASFKKESSASSRAGSNKDSNKKAASKSSYTSKNSTKTTGPHMDKGKSKGEKDFIKRNIQLAQDGAGVMSMTEEEKARLNELLLDIDEFDQREAKANGGTSQQQTVVVEYNPFVVNVAQGDGFTPEVGDLERLKQIESELEKKTYSRLSSSSRVSGLSSVQLFSKHSINSGSNVVEPDVYYGLSHSANEIKQISLNDEFDENEFGDKFIREARVSREQEVRLKMIESQLERIKQVSSNSIHSETNSELDSDNVFLFC
jgi:hypothetical protein